MSELITTRVARPTIIKNFVITVNVKFVCHAEKLFFYGDGGKLAGCPFRAYINSLEKQLLALHF